MDESLKPGATFWQVAINLPKEASPNVEAFFLESGAQGFYELLYQEGVTDNLNNDDTRLFFFFSDDFPVRAFVPMALASLGLADAHFQIEKIAFEDYIRQFEDSFKAFPLTSNTWLVPPWDAENPEIPPDALRLALRPGLAFGTGKHATSQLMVEFLEKHISGRESVLDLGAGSGILAIAAKLLGAGTVIGVEVEQISVDSAIENGELNFGDSAEVKFYQGDFSFRHREDYSIPDIFVANILPQIFKKNAKDLFAYLRESSCWALSGISEPQREDFSTFLSDAGFEFRVMAKEGWLLFHSN